MDIEIYTSSFCGYCLLAKKILINRDIPFVETNLDMDPNKRTEMNRRSGGQTSVPQIFFSGSHIGGHKELSILEKNGALDLFLNQKNSV